MRFKYENLEVYQLAKELVPLIYKLLEKFPNTEKFGLINQGKRAIISVILNIAEGSSRHTDRDFSGFINRSITSLQEVDTVLKAGIVLKYITDEDYKIVESKIEKLYFKLIALDKKLRGGHDAKNR